MKKELYIVEGQHDIINLKKINKDFFVIATNGLGYDEKFVSNLIELEKQFQIVLLLDPDGPGETIRRDLAKRLRQPIHIFVPKDVSFSKNNRKIGVEHINLANLEKLLEKKVIPNDNKQLNLYDLYQLGLTGTVNSSKSREIISNKYYIGICNSQRMLERLNWLGISKEELSEVLEDATKR